MNQTTKVSPIVRPNLGYEIVSGTVIGKEHIRVSKNNQDAACHYSTGSALIAVVCDGCGSGDHSELGAGIGATFVVRHLLEWAGTLTDVGVRAADVLEIVRKEVVSSLSAVAQGMKMPGASYTKLVEENFLFTVIGACITPSRSVFFSIGDGIFAVDGTVFQIGPFANNAPPYIGYGMLKQHVDLPGGEEAYKFRIIREQTGSPDSFLLGSDGVIDLIAAEEKNLPGRDKVVGPISQFWSEDKYFSNSDNLRRHLTLVNRETFDAEGRIVKGHLSDDTTVVVARRKAEEVK